LFFEIIPKLKFPSISKVPRSTHILDVVGADTLLGSRCTFELGRSLSQKIGLNGSIQRSSAARGVFWHEEALGDFVSPLGVVEEFLANFATAEVLDKKAWV